MSIRWRGPFGRWSPTLFLLAGAVLLTLLAIGQTVRFTAASIPRTAYWPLFPLAVAFALAGLVGCYPRLAGRARLSALLGGGVALLGGGLLFAGLGTLLLVSPPGPYPGSLGALGAPFFLGLLAFIAAMGIYGVSSLRTGFLPPRIGALMLLSGFLQAVELVGAEVVFASAGTSAPSGFYVLFETVVYGLIAAALLSIGYSLRHEAATPGLEDTASATAWDAETL